MSLETNPRASDSTDAASSERPPESTPPNVEQPPLPRLVLRVGVTGHRLNKLRQADWSVLTEQVRKVLRAIKATVSEAAERYRPAYADEAPKMRLVCVVAEGADQLVAHTAIECGYDLQCPLPFSRDDYANDFGNTEARQEYARLLLAASSVFELDGRRGSKRSEEQAYSAAGHLLVRQCDVMIAVWDGRPAEGPGGTAEVVEEASKLGVPVVRIDSQAPHAITYNRQDNALAELSGAIHKRLVPPEALVGNLYANESFRRNKPRLFDLMTKVVGADSIGELIGRESTIQPIKFRSVVSSLRSIVSSKISQGDDIRLPEINRHYRWADALAIFYAARFRSTTIWMYLLACLAVICAVLAVPLRPYKLATPVFTFAELLLIICIVISYRRARHGGWHERWLAYRSLAEHLRVIDFLSLLGLTRPEFRAPLHAANDDPSSRWVDWHFRSIVREFGLPPAAVNANYLKTASEQLRRAISGQKAYHEKLARRYKNVQERLHRFGELMFLTTLPLCCWHLIDTLQELKVAGNADTHHLTGMGEWLIFGAAVLPAAGASLAGILAQGEFKRLARRSEGMHRGLGEVLNVLPAGGPSLTFESLEMHADDAAKVMLSEVQDWQVLFQSHPPVLPG